MEGARQAQKLVRETSRAAYDTAVASPAEKVQQGIDRCEMEKFTDGFCRVLFTVLLVGAILAAWVYWLFWPIWWLAKGRFELTSGWTAAKCTIVQQRCYVTCKRPTTCLGSCTSCDDRDGMFLSDACVWLDKTKFIRDARGAIVREDTPHSSAVLSPRMSSLRLLGGGCLVVAFFRAPAAVRMLTLAAMVAVASGSVGGEGDTSMTERQSEGEGGLRGRAAELQSRGDAGSNLTYFGHLDQRSPECCRKAFSIAVEFRVGSACAAGDATCLGVPPSRAHSLPLCSPPPVFQPQKRACASTQNTRHYSYVCLHAYTCRCVCICIYVQRKSESKGRMAGVCVVGLNLSPSSTLPPSNLSLSLSLSLSLYAHTHTQPSFTSQRYRI